MVQLRSMQRRAAAPHQTQATSHSDDDPESNSDSDSDMPLCRLVPKRKSKPPAAAAAPSPKKKRVATQDDQKSSSDNAPTITRDPIVPDWLMLPELVWVNIFQHAAFSDDTLQYSSHWLSSLCRLCRQLVSPVTRALYMYPQLKTAPQMLMLSQLLEKDPDTNYAGFDYRRMIKGLLLDVQYIPPHTVVNFLNFTPQLRYLDFYSLKDNLDHLNETRPLRWKYRDLFENPPCSSQLGPAENESDTTLVAQLFPQNQHLRLHSFTWNGRMMSKDFDFGSVASIHQTPSFQTLQKITFVKHVFPNPRRPEHDPDFVQQFKDCIAALPRLEHVVFRNCDILDADLLSCLPTNLKQLEITNCFQLDMMDEEMINFLESHGQSLTHLTLNHNMGLSLDFLMALGQDCPNLQELCMDMRCTGTRLEPQNINPIYNDCFSSLQTPLWPKSIRLINIDNSPNWSLEASKMFLTSFIDQAPDLGMLRSLIIKANLNFPWRTRAAFRAEWEQKLRDVFLRKMPDPVPYTSLSQHSVVPREKKPSTGVKQVDAVDAESPSSSILAKKRKKPKAINRRQSSRIASRVASGSSRASRSFSGELRRIERNSYQEPVTDSDEFDSDGEDSDVDDSNKGSGSEGSDSGDIKIRHEPPPTGSDEQPPYVQGLCTKVDIVVDNRKPSLHQFSMDDFMDDDVDLEAIENDDDEWDSDTL